MLKCSNIYVNFFLWSDNQSKHGNSEISTSEHMAPTEEGFSFWGGRRGVVVPHEHDILGLKCSNSHIQVHQQLFPCSANFKTSNRGGGGINSQDLTYDQQWTIIQVENSTRSFKKLHFQKLGTHISKFVLTQHISYDRDQLFYHKKCNFDYKLKNQGKILPYANVIFHARIKVDKVIVSPMTST